jgi:hypothetical protein
VTHYRRNRALRLRHKPFRAPGTFAKHREFPMKSHMGECNASDHTFYSFGAQRINGSAGAERFGRRRHLTAESRLDRMDWSSPRNRRRNHRSEQAERHDRPKRRSARRSRSQRPACHSDRRRYQRSGPATAAQQNSGIVRLNLIALARGSGCGRRRFRAVAAEKR